MHRFLEVEMRGQRCQVVGVMIHVLAAIGLGGTAMSAPVVGYDAIAVLEEEQHLRVPIIGRQRPDVAKQNGLSFAPVLVVDLRPIFRHNCRHVMFSFALVPLKLHPTFVLKYMQCIATGGRQFLRNTAQRTENAMIAGPSEAANTLPKDPVRSLRSEEHTSELQ